MLIVLFFFLNIRNKKKNVGYIRFSRRNISLEIACEPAAVHAGAGQASQWGRLAVAVAMPLLPAQVV